MSNLELKYNKAKKLIANNDELCEYYHCNENKMQNQIKDLQNINEDLLQDIEILKNNNPNFTQTNININNNYFRKYSNDGNENINHDFTNSNNDCEFKDNQNNDYCAQNSQSNNHHKHGFAGVFTEQHSMDLASEMKHAIQMESKFVGLMVCLYCVCVCFVCFLCAKSVQRLLFLCFKFCCMFALHLFVLTTQKGAPNIKMLETTKKLSKLQRNGQTRTKKRVHFV